MNVPEAGHGRRDGLDGTAVTQGVVTDPGVDEYDGTGYGEDEHGDHSRDERNATFPFHSLP